jgi:hypothetical protein
MMGILSGAWELRQATGNAPAGQAFGVQLQDVDLLVPLGATFQFQASGAVANRFTRVSCTDGVQATWLWTSVQAITAGQLRFCTYGIGVPSNGASLDGIIFTQLPWALILRPATLSIACANIDVADNIQGVSLTYAVRRVP